MKRCDPSDVDFGGLGRDRFCFGFFEDERFCLDDKVIIGGEVFKVKTLFQSHNNSWYVHMDWVRDASIEERLDEVS